MAGGGVNNRAGVVVIVHKFLVGRGELRNQVIHDGQILIQRVEFAVNVAGDGFAGVARVARLGDEQIVGGNDGFERGQLGGGHAEIGEAGEVRVRVVVNVLATLGGLHVTARHQIADGKIVLGRQFVVFVFGGVGMNGAGNGQGDIAHGLTRLLFVRRNAAGVLLLALRQELNVGNPCLQIRVGGCKGGDGG